MENSYQPIDDPLSALADYDSIVHQYYDLRDTKKPVDTFTAQMAARMAAVPDASPSLLDILQRQGFLKE